MPEATVSLGFTERCFHPGAHICQIFSDDADRDRVLSCYVAAGLRNGERCACFSDHAKISVLLDSASEEGIDTQAVKRSGALTVAGTADAYFAEGRFEPERMLGKLVAFHHESLERGHPSARIIGEMTRQIEEVPGGSRLLEYEARVSLLLREHPITTVCQYDARAFEGSSIMDVLRVHPFILIRGAVVENPFYVPPEQLLAQRVEET